MKQVSKKVFGKNKLRGKERRRSVSAYSDDDERAQRARRSPLNGKGARVEKGVRYTRKSSNFYTGRVHVWKREKRKSNSHALCSFGLPP